MQAQSLILVCLFVAFHDANGFYFPVQDYKSFVFVQRRYGEDRSQQEEGRNFGWQKGGLEIGKKVFYCPSHLVWLALWWTRTRKLHFPRSDP